MIPRYTRRRMGQLWELENKFRNWLKVELVVCEAWAEAGEIPLHALNLIKERANFNLKRIEELEKEVKHDVIAFLTSLAEFVGPESRYIHKGLTSSDVLDTALALQMKDASDIILDDIKSLMEILKHQALRFKNTPAIGRSHGVHGEPIVFGLKFCVWYKEMERNFIRVKRAKEIISVGKLSGAVGTFSSIPPEIEENLCRKLGLIPEPVATQVVQRDRHAEFLITLAIVAATIEKIAIEIRHLQRTEVLEVEEPFTKGQKGSSAMPHKRNPVGSENLTGLARIVRSNAIASLENIALWHERDISHSSVERVIIPDSTILVDYMLNRLTGILKDLQVYPEQMMENIGKSRQLYNSQKVLLTLVEKGMTREEAYKVVQDCAMKSWKEKRDFLSILSEDDKIGKHLTAMQLKDLFRLEHYFEHIEFIYQRVFQDKQP